MNWKLHGSHLNGFTMTSVGFVVNSYTFEWFQLNLIHCYENGQFNSILFPMDSGFQGIPKKSESNRYRFASLKRFVKVWFMHTHRWYIDVSHDIKGTF
jgi:hypothetical protein